ncbi:MAG: c-type cytochrome [bacterium]|nr:c-type cytochrome [bacterium]
MPFDYRRALVITALCALAVGLALPVAAQNWPPEPKNLQYFPEDTDPRQLIQTMRGFAMGLGVRCQHCHVGEEGQPIFTFDFASDEKETKRKARVMLEMMDAINDEYLTQLGVETAGLLRVECVICHRGVARPEQLKDILAAVGSSEGAEAAVAKYGELREKHLGSGSYDFSEGTLIRAAEALAGAGHMDQAVALLEESLVHTPQSSWALGTLAGVENKRGNTEAAIAALKRILEFEPDNARVRQQIDKLSNPVPETPAEADS